MKVLNFSFKFVSVLKLKQNISLLLAITIMSCTIWQTIILTHFYINQTEIIKEHCVNKNKINSSCHGQCHLKKELEKTIVQTDTNTTETPNKTKSVLFFLAYVDTNTNDTDFVALEELQKDSFSEQETSSHISPIFTPPEHLHYML